MPEKSAIPTVKDVPVQNVGVRPDLFQARDTSGKESYSEDRVKEIVANWNPERFDPIAVVANPERDGEYIVIGGHHRLEAVKRLNLQNVPVRVLSGDIRDTGERQRLEREAVVSNFGVAESNLRERVTAAGRLSDSGLSNREVATEMRIRPVEADRLLWLRRLPPGIVERAMVQPELTPAAAELGRAMEKHSLGDEAVGGLFTRWVRDYDDTGKIPGQYVLRQQLDALAKAGQNADTSQQGFGGLAGFGGDATLGAFDTERKKAEQIETRLRGTKQRLTSCQSLADELGVDIKDVHVAAGAVLDELTAEQEKAVRSTIALHRAQTAGEGPETPQDQPHAYATGQDSQSFPGMESPAGAPAEQPGLGDDFATNRSFAMPIDGGQATSAPLADPEVLAAEQERREILAAGGIDMFGNTEKTEAAVSTTADPVSTPVNRLTEPPDSVQEQHIADNYAYSSELRRFALSVNQTAALGNRKAKADLLAKLERMKADGGLDFQYTSLVDTGIESLRSSLPAKNDANAAVKEAAADGQITPAEAKETADEAAQVLSAAARETPDSPAPKRAYRSDEDIDARVEELCNDPDAMREVLERAQSAAAKSATQRRSSESPRVADDVRSAAGRILSQKAKDSPQPSEGERKPRRSRISDVELLEKAVEKCTASHPSGDMAKQAKDFLASRNSVPYGTIAERMKAFKESRKTESQEQTPGPKAAASTGGKASTPSAARMPTSRTAKNPEAALLGNGPKRRGKGRPKGSRNKPKGKAAPRIVFQQSGPKGQANAAPRNETLIRTLFGADVARAGG